MVGDDASRTRPDHDVAGNKGSGDGASPDQAADGSGGGNGFADRLGLADLVPGALPLPGAAGRGRAIRPGGPAPAGEAVADYGHGGHGYWPVVAGLLAIAGGLAGGAALVWWRRRDRNYWPA